MKTALVTGAGGFIGGHLVARLKEKYNVVAVDLKPFDKWYQVNPEVENLCLDLNSYDNCLRATSNVDLVFHLACNMGGMGFIELHKAACMMSVIPDTYMLKASVENNVEKFLFTSSACVYPKSLQSSTENIPLREDMVYPADSEDGYGWEKLFIERMCRHFTEDFGIETRVARFHTIYGPVGTWQGGREKAPAALCRKIIEAKYFDKNEIEIWGDGEQTRSFLYVDDCVDGILTLFDSNFKYPLNIGSEVSYSINQMVDIIENHAEIKVNRKYILDAPLGVRGRNSDSTQLKSMGWYEKNDLQSGLIKTYNWIEKQFKSFHNL